MLLDMPGCTTPCPPPPYLSGRSSARVPQPLLNGLRPEGPSSLLIFPQYCSLSGSQETLLTPDTSLSAHTVQ